MIEQFLYIINVIDFLFYDMVMCSVSFVFFVIDNFFVRLNFGFISN